MLGNLDLDETSGKSVADQLQETLQKNAGRVIDLFREWDTDGDGEVRCGWCGTPVAMVR